MTESDFLFVAFKGLVSGLIVGLTLGSIKYLYRKSKQFAIRALNLH